MTRKVSRQADESVAKKPVPTFVSLKQVWQGEMREADEKWRKRKARGKRENPTIR